MDLAGYSIRPYVDTDVEAEVRIDREMDPEHAPTAEELRHWNGLLLIERDRVNLKFAVEERATGEVVAYGSLAQPSFNYDPRRFWIWVAVRPAHRRRGIGSQIYTHLEGEAVARNGLGLWGNTREEDPAGVRFLEGRGFRILRKGWQSRLDLTTLNLSEIPDRAARLEREGFRFVTLAEEGATSLEVRRRLYRLCQICDADVPHLGPFHPVSFEEFVAIDLDSPGAMPEGVFLARKDAEIVGMSSLERDLARPDTLRVGYTGTMPEFRGHGLATELKRRAVHFARERGFRFLVTHNDSMNRPIWAINQRLGFRQETVWIQGEKPLVASSAAETSAMPPTQT